MNDIRPVRVETMKRTEEESVRWLDAQPAHHRRPAMGVQNSGGIRTLLRKPAAWFRGNDGYRMPPPAQISCQTFYVTFCPAADIWQAEWMC